MKIFGISKSADGRIALTPGVDSAVLRPGEPVFVPEPFADWRAAVAPAVRIGRLGMNIKESSARAYCEALTAFSMLTPAEGSDAACGLPPFVLDRAFSPGNWLELPGADARLCLRAELSAIGSDDVLLSEVRDFAVGDMQLEKVIAHISRFITLKTGDVLLFTDFATAAFEPVPDTTLNVAINDSYPLSIRFK